MKQARKKKKGIGTMTPFYCYDHNPQSFAFLYGGAKVQVTGHRKKQWDTGQNCSGLTLYYTKIK